MNSNTTGSDFSGQIGNMKFKYVSEMDSFEVEFKNAKNSKWIEIESPERVLLLERFAKNEKHKGINAAITRPINQIKHFISFLIVQQKHTDAEIEKDAEKLYGVNWRNICPDCKEIKAHRARIAGVNMLTNRGRKIDREHWGFKKLRYQEILSNQSTLSDTVRSEGYDETNQEAFTYLDDIPSQDNILEGAQKSVLVNAYERNPVARRRCIEHYGTKCSCCGFDFREKYGNIGAGFIHVHHLLELSSIRKEYKVDPIKDLRPVCPNCHAMIHQRKPAYGVNELKNLLEQNT